MEPYFSSISVKDGKVILAIKEEIWKSGDVFCKFIKYSKEEETKLHISTYTDQVCETVPMGWYGKLERVSLVIDVKKMLLDRLKFFFMPETEFSVADSLSFLRLQGGLSSGELQRVLNISKNTFSRLQKYQKQLAAMPRCSSN
jgi:hypothetical protein